MANNVNKYLTSTIRETANKKHNELTSQMDILKFGKRWTCSHGYRTTATRYPTTSGNTIGIITSEKFGII